MAADLLAVFIAERGWPARCLLAACSLFHPFAQSFVAKLLKQPICLSNITAVIQHSIAQSTSR